MRINSYFLTLRWGQWNFHASTQCQLNFSGDLQLLDVQIWTSYFFGTSIFCNGPFPSNLAWNSNLRNSNSPRSPVCQSQDPFITRIFLDLQIREFKVIVADTTGRRLGFDLCWDLRAKESRTKVAAPNHSYQFLGSSQTFLTLSCPGVSYWTGALNLFELVRWSLLFCPVARFEFEVGLDWQRMASLARTWRTDSHCCAQW